MPGKRKTILAESRQRLKRCITHCDNIETNLATMHKWYSADYEQYAKGLAMAGTTVQSLRDFVNDLETALGEL